MLVKFCSNTGASGHWVGFILLYYLYSSHHFNNKKLFELKLKLHLSKFDFTH